MVTRVMVWWVLVGVLGFDCPAGEFAWIGESRVANWALRVSAALMSRSKVTLAYFDIVAGDVDEVGGTGGPRTCSILASGHVDAGGDFG